MAQNYRRCQRDHAWRSADCGRRSRVTSLTEGQPLRESGLAQLFGGTTVISSDSFVAASSSVTVSGAEGDVGAGCKAAPGGWRAQPAVHPACNRPDPPLATSFAHPEARSARGYGRNGRLLARASSALGPRAPAFAWASILQSTTRVLCRRTGTHRGTDWREVFQDGAARLRLLGPIPRRLRRTRGRNARIPHPSGRA
jgi:hypothetical protein